MSKEMEQNPDYWSGPAAQEREVTHFKPKGERMSEYIVRETGFPGQLKQEVVGELVRCKECENWQCSLEPQSAEKGKHYCEHIDWYSGPNDFCSGAERRTDE